MLILTKWDVEDSVYVPSGIVSNLQNYHLAGIRFLYDCYHNRLKGGILNHDVDMNFPAQLSAFFTALKKKIQLISPALIICSENRLLKWLYHLKIYGNFTVHCPKGSISEDINEEIIMVSIHETKVLQNLIEKNFSFIVIEEFDLISNKRILKQLQGNFHIGLTTHNFIKCPNQKVFFEMVNWTNPGVLGKFSQFKEDDTEHIQNFRWPYEKYWHRLTWNFCNTFVRPTVEEEKESVERMELWAKQEKIEMHLLTDVNIPKKRRHNKIEPKKEQEEVQTDSFMSSDNSNDYVESLGKKTNIRKKKRKVTPNKHIKGKSGKYIKRKGDSEINFRETLRVENNVVANNFDLDCKSELNSEKKFLNLNIQSNSENGNFAHSRGSPKLSTNTLQNKKRKKKKNLPLLSSSSSAEGSQSDEDNSIISWLFKTEKLEEKNKYCFTENKKTQSQLDLCMMLDQSIDEFETSLEKNQSDKNNDVLLSIISPEKKPLGNLKKITSFEVGKFEIESSKKLETDEENFIVLNSSEKLPPKILKNKQDILSLLSSLNSDCDI